MNAALRRLSNPHPTFFKFINSIRMNEFSKSIDLLESEKLDETFKNCKHKKVEILDAKIKELTMS